MISSTGNTANNYLYAGEQYDSNLDNYYLRARYYDPSVGRFTARDPFEGLMTNPLSLAKYPYVHGNPVNLIDPSGLFAGLLSSDSAWATVRAVYASLSSTAVSTVTRLGSSTFPKAVQAASPAIANAERASISIGGRIAVSVARATMQLLSTAMEAIELSPLPGFPIILWGQELPATTLHTFEAITGTSTDFKDGVGRAVPFLGRKSVTISTFISC